MRRGTRDVPETRHSRNLAKRFEAHGESYFRFLTTPGLEPTNNLAEQAIRFVVIDRLITQGTRSEAGNRWCERIWTVIATCAQQGRSVFLVRRPALGHGGRLQALRGELQGPGPPRRHRGRGAADRGRGARVATTRPMTPHRLACHQLRISWIDTTEERAMKIALGADHAGFDLQGEPARGPGRASARGLRPGDVRPVPARRLPGLRRRGGPHSSKGRPSGASCSAARGSGCRWPRTRSSGSGRGSATTRTPPTRAWSTTT